MTIDKYSELDPAKLARDLMELDDTLVIDKWSLMDPARMRSTLDTHYETEFSNAALMDPARFLRELSSVDFDGGEPDDDRPEWVPADALVHVDFVGQRAWTLDDGEVAIDTLLGADPNTENGFGTTVDIVPEDYHEYGLVYTNSRPALKGALLAGALDEATFVFGLKQYTDDALGGGGRQFVIMSEDGSDAIEVTVRGPASGSMTSAASYNGDLDEEIINNANAGQDAVNIIALTITPEQVEVAVNGGEEILAGVIAESDRPPGNPLIAGLFDYDSSKDALTHITMYAPLPLTEIEQPENHAPTSIESAQWYAGDGVQPGLESTITLEAELPRQIVRLKGIDPDGNRLTYSVVDGDGLDLSTESTEFGDDLNQNIVLDSPAANGTYHPVFRATDPGGLYVDQEFTIIFAVEE